MKEGHCSPFPSTRGRRRPCWTCWREAASARARRPCTAAATGRCTTPSTRRRARSCPCRRRSVASPRHPSQHSRHHTPAAHGKESRATHAPPYRAAPRLPCAHERSAGGADRRSAQHLLDASAHNGRTGRSMRRNTIATHPTATFDTPDCAGPTAACTALGEAATANRPPRAPPPQNPPIHIHVTTADGERSTTAWKEKTGQTHKAAHRSVSSY